MTFQDLKLSPYYFRWAQVDANDMVSKVSVEKVSLTEEFRQYLVKHGFKEIPGRGRFDTAHFELVEKKRGG